MSVELSKDKGSIARAFKGNERLSIVYWIYLLPFSVLSKLLFAYFSSSNFSVDVILFYVIAAEALLAILHYLIFENLFNVKNEVWSYIVLILFILNFSGIFNHEINGIISLITLLCFTILIGLFVGYKIAKRKGNFESYKRNYFKRALTLITFLVLHSFFAIAIMLPHTKI